MMNKLTATKLEAITRMLNMLDKTHVENVVDVRSQAIITLSCDSRESLVRILEQCVCANAALRLSPKYQSDGLIHDVRFNLIASYRRGAGRGLSTFHLIGIHLIELTEHLGVLSKADSATFKALFPRTWGAG